MQYAWGRLASLGETLISCLLVSPCWLGGPACCCAVPSIRAHHGATHLSGAAQRAVFWMMNDTGNCASYQHATDSHRRLGNKDPVLKNSCQLPDDSSLPPSLSQAPLAFHGQRLIRSNDEKASRARMHTL